MVCFKNLLFLSLILISCDESNDSVQHNYHELKDDIISWNEIFNQSDDYYLVYFYSERCGHCNGIKQEMIDFYLSETIPMYFVCTDVEVMFGPVKELKGINSIDEFYIFGTPFLINVFNQHIQDYFLGSNEILQYISTIYKK